MDCHDGRRYYINNNGAQKVSTIVIVFFFRDDDEVFRPYLRSCSGESLVDQMASSSTRNSKGTRQHDTVSEW
jgi:hypothetical protein